MILGIVVALVLALLGLTLFAKAVDWDNGLAIIAASALSLASVLAGIGLFVATVTDGAQWGETYSEDGCTVTRTIEQNTESIFPWNWSNDVIDTSTLCPVE